MDLHSSGQSKPALDVVSTGCGEPVSIKQKGKNEMHVCCVKDPNFKVNITEEEFLPRNKEGDLIIYYDVLRSYEQEYWAQVTISNHNPLGRLDNWQLSWDWMREEFIQTMRGAYPSIVDSTDCIYGSQGDQYKDLDFSNVLNCKKRPTIVDPPLTKANDSTLGLILFCCRDGTILPPSMEPSNKAIESWQQELK